MMPYDVDALGEGTTFERGSSLLFTGPSSDLEERLFDVVAPAAGERVAVITMNHGAGWVLEQLEDRGVDPDHVGVIDCTDGDLKRDDANVRQLASPGDLTGISLEFAKLLDNWGESTPVRVGFASVSTALMYADLRTIFRFLHVFTARIRSGGMFGVFAMDPSMHEEQDHNTIRAVFDSEATVAEDSVDLRGTGFER